MDAKVKICVPVFLKIWYTDKCILFLNYCILNVFSLVNVGTFCHDRQICCSPTDLVRALQDDKRAKLCGSGAICIRYQFRNIYENPVLSLCISIITFNCFLFIIQIVL